MYPKKVFSIYLITFLVCVVFLPQESYADQVVKESNDGKNVSYVAECDEGGKITLRVARENIFWENQACVEPYMAGSFPVTSLQKAMRIACQCGSE